MSCGNSCHKEVETKKTSCGGSYVIIIVLYILLAIIIGSCMI